MLNLYFMFKKIFISIISFLFCLQIVAQNIKGKVVDATSRQPLEGVSIFNINASFIKTTTDQQGNFIFPSEGNVLIAYVGYRADTVALSKLSNNIVALQPSIISLKDIVLKSNSNFKFNTLSKIDLDLKPVKNSQELLRIVPGLFIAQHAGGGKAEQIFLRGFDCDHGTDIQISVDGLPVNMVSHAHGQGYADLHFVIPETINNIDFGAGPYYTQHGNLNTAGYVAFSTFKNIAQSKVTVDAGKFNSFRTLAMIDLLKKNKDKQSAYIAAEFNYTDGPTVNKQNFSKVNVFAKYNLAISDNTQLNATLSSFVSKWDASGQVPTRAVDSGSISRFGSIDPSEGGNTQRDNANIIVNHNFKNGSNWINQIFYSKYIFNLYSNFTFYLNNPIYGDEINQSESRNMYGYSSALNHKYFFGNKILKSTYGIGLRYDETNNTRLSHVEKRVFSNDIKLGNIKESNSYAFIQQELIAGKWLFDAGVRLDYFNFNYLDKLNFLQQPSQAKAIACPKFNVQYNLNSTVQLFVKAGKGFHSNDARVVVSNAGNQILPAAYSTDIGITLKPNPNILLTITAWELYLEQEFVYNGDDGNIEPSGKTNRDGIDITARLQFTKNIFANANFNFTNPKEIGVTKGQNYIPLAPTASSTGGIFYKEKKGINGSITYRYIKNRPANEDNSLVAKGYFLLDASVNYTKPKYEFGLAFENILNTKWNEAQFATTSRLMNEPAPVTDLNFTAGTPFFARAKFTVFF